MRTLLVHLRVTVPMRDRRKDATIVRSIEKALEDTDADRAKGVVVEIESVERVVPQGMVYTVHPFDDEWIWEQKHGSYPWATSSLEDAIAHANLVRLEHSTSEDADPAFISGFWSSIYADVPGESARADSMIGYVDPLGDYHEGDEPPLDSSGAYVGEGL